MGILLWKKTNHCILIIKNLPKNLARSYLIGFCYESAAYLRLLKQKDN